MRAQIDKDANEVMKCARIENPPFLLFLNLINSSLHVFVIIWIKDKLGNRI